jgi:exopolysaccharide biosynthesis protein
VVGIKPDGTVVIMVNDGRQEPYSAGMSMYELAEVMLDLGCSYAVNCDGGGSTTWVSQRPGEDLKVNNSPSDGAERPTTTGILFISTAPATGEFARASITTENDY